jgi:DNA-binding NarL/FixJ family response regulator
LSESILRALLVDDSEADAELIVAFLRSSGRPVEAHRASSAVGLQEALEHFRPQVVLADHGLPGFSSLDALRTLKRLAPTIPFIVVSGHMDDGMKASLLGAGADDLVSKEALEGLPPALERACERREGLRRLSPRQVEVLILIVHGNTTPEIAARLGLSEKTVQTHRSELMRRLDIHDVSGLVRFAMRVRLVALNED